jgi:WD40 repeat protein
LPLLSADGRIFVVPADGQKLRVCDCTTGVLRREIADVDGVLTLTADGKSCFGWTAGGVPQRWDLESGKALWPEIPEIAHSGGVARVTFSPNSRMLVSLGSDNEARLWDINTATIRAVAKAAPDSLVVFTPDGQQVIIAGSQGLVQWDIAKNRAVRKLSLADMTIDAMRGVAGLTLSTDSKSAILLIDKDNSELLVLACDLATGKTTLQQTLEWSAAECTLFRGGERILRPTGEVRLAQTGEIKLTLRPPPTASPRYWKGPTAVAQSAAIGVCGTGPIQGDDLQNLMFPNGDVAQDQSPYLWILDINTGRMIHSVRPQKVNQLALSANGRWLAIAEPNQLGMWETITSRRVTSLNLPGIQSLTFSPDGRTLATGLANGTVLIWDLAPHGFQPNAKLTPAELTAAWDDLASSDDQRCYAAPWRLTAGGINSVALLRTRLKPVEPLTADRLRRLVADLDSRRYAARESACRELAGLGARAVQTLQSAQTGALSPEASWRVDRLLVRKFFPYSTETVRFLRAVDVLERIGTPDARELLVKLSSGDPQVPETQAVREALERMK